MIWPFTRSKVAPVVLPRVEPVVALPAVERRASGTGYTTLVMQARESYIRGASGLGELTATAQACVSLWESGLAIAKVEGTSLLDRRTMALIGRSLALRGEFVGIIGPDGITPASDWDLSTRGGRPRAYRLSISESGGGSTMTALAPEVLHVRIGSDPVAPWTGTAPLRRSSLTAAMLHAVESALAEVYELAPLGTAIVPFPEASATDMQAMGADFKGRRGRILLRESVTVASAGGPQPASDWRPQSVSPDLQGAMPDRMLAMARNSVACAFGVLPALFDSAAQGPLVREAQRHLAQWTLQPIGELLAEEASDKLGATVTVDTMGPLQAFDAGGSARAFATLIEGLARAREAGIDAKAALAMLDWQQD